MLLARTQLFNGSEPVSQIAWLCGFADPAYFSLRFSHTDGMPLEQYRRQHQSK